MIAYYFTYQLFHCSLLLLLVLFFFVPKIVLLSYLSFVIQVLSIYHMCFWQFGKIALSRHYPVDFLLFFGFPFWRQRNLIFCAWIYCRPTGNLCSFHLQFVRILSITPDCCLCQTIIFLLEFKCLRSLQYLQATLGKWNCLWMDTKQNKINFSSPAHSHLIFSLNFAKNKLWSVQKGFHK